jgi:hypothetical protein
MSKINQLPGEQIKEEIEIIQKNIEYDVNLFINYFSLPRIMEK